MKIKNWDKINGITYRGRCIVNPIHNADETKYSADIIDISLPHKPKWELSVIVPGHKFKDKNDNTINVILHGHNNYSSRVVATKEMMISLQHFRMLYEKLVEEVLEMEITTSVLSTSNLSNGVLNVVSNSGTTIDYTKVVNEVIDILQNDSNVSKDLKTALNDLINKQ